MIGITLGTSCHPNFERHPRRRSRVQFPENKVLSSTLFREMLTFSCKFNHNHCFSSLWKVDIAGITGPVKFDENGRRIVSRLEILNLRNDSFKRVSSMKAMNNPIFFSSDWVFWKRKTLDWISTTIDIKKGFFKRVGTVDLNHPVLLSASTSFNSKTEFLLLLTLLMCRWSSSIRKGTSLLCYFSDYLLTSQIESCRISTRRLIPFQ